MSRSAGDDYADVHSVGASRDTSEASIDHYEDMNSPLHRSRSRVSSRDGGADSPREQSSPPVQVLLAPRFRQCGEIVALYPRLVLLFSICCVAILTSGLICLEVVTDPLRLWVPPTSRAAADKAAYEEAFGPFYRVEQLILSTLPSDDGSRTPILTRENLDLVRRW
jgi:hypothetical protein